MNKNLYSAFWHMFFPARCCCCGELTEERALICQTCLTQLPYIPLDCCTQCGLSRKQCECNRVQMLFSGISAPFYNKGVAKQGIYALKMNQQRDNAQFFAICMAERFSALFPDIRPDFVTAVPMHPRKKLKVGFNHAEVLAKHLAEYLGIEYCGKTLKKSGKNTEGQHTLSYVQRIQHVQGIYTAACDLRGKTVLLVDDIRTTAATLNACTKQLLLAGADAVYCATALLTDRKDKNEMAEEPKKDKVKSK